ncbi:MAG: DUF1492 domain-containing protein [Clostridiales bacterium]|nr:DUF1492 domain-containing protein [Clostridiales bacterium]
MKNTNKVVKKCLTEKELKTFLLLKLNSLYSDVNLNPEKTAAYLEEIRKTSEDKRRLLMNVYAQYYAPAKVTDYSGLPKRECDMTGEMLDFSSGFDSYIASIEEQYNIVVKQKQEAVALLSLVLSLKQPYSRILYFRYYKKMSTKETCREMHIARTTFFRKREAALSELSKVFAVRNDIKVLDI